MVTGSTSIAAKTKYAMFSKVRWKSGWRTKRWFLRQGAPHTCRRTSRMRFVIRWRQHRVTCLWPFQLVLTNGSMHWKVRGGMVRWTMKCTANSPWTMESNGWSNRMNLLWLGDPRSFDVAVVGGKAANLSRLARLYHRVPDGFSIPVTLMNEAHPLEL
jgi:hypothetical protein